MAAITFTKTPPRNHQGIGFWQSLKYDLQTAKDIISDSSSNYSSSNTVAELDTAIDAIIAAISGVL